jgi:hypothetical protein
MTDSISRLLGNLDLAGDEELSATLQALIERCNALHQEVDTYISAILTKRKHVGIFRPDGYRFLHTEFKNETEVLKRIASSNLGVEKTRHSIVSSNFPHIAALWSAAKRAKGLQAFRTWFYWDTGYKKKQPQEQKAGKGKTRAIVDIVADEGKEWIRVSTVSEKRLLYELAKLGWINDSDSDDDMPDVSSDVDHDEDQVDIVKNARDLARAASANPVRGRPPRVRFVLTRIEYGKRKEVDQIVDKMRATGAIVQCAEDIPATPSIEYALPSLLIDQSRAVITDTINMDCTILMALISDISHKDCPIQDWYNGEVVAQIEEEAEEHLLPTYLYPAIGSHAMVTTQEAAEQMRVIVETLATDSEKARADVLLGQGAFKDRTPDALVKEWLTMSNYGIPDGFRLPIHVVNTDVDAMTRKLPPVAKILAEELGPLNAAIFLYGWAEGFTTLSANRVRAKQINMVINQHRLDEGQDAPHIWLYDESRSLIAKHGRRK